MGLAKDVAAFASNKNNVEMPIEQSIMNLGEREKRLIVILSSIAPGTRGRKTFRKKMKEKEILASDLVTYRSAEVERNSVSLTFDRTSEFTELDQSVPLDAVESVWQRVDGTWNISTRRSLRAVGRND